VVRECLKDLYSCPGVGSARSCLAKFYTHCAVAGVAEQSRLAKPIRSWEIDILA
jgi:hypothetical protein